MSDNRFLEMPIIGKRQSIGTYGLGSGISPNP